MKINIENEQTLEEYLYSHMLNGWCPITEERITKAFRQVDTGCYGIIDLISFSDSITDDESSEMISQKTIRIFELKKGILDFSAFAQIARYKKCVERFMGKVDSQFRECSVEYFLVGGGMPTNNDIVFLSDSLEWLKTIVFEIDLDTGISFSESRGWHNTGEDFGKLSTFSKNLLLISGSGSAEDGKTHG